MIAHFSQVDKKKENKGLLFASGLITGEALMGIAVAIPIFLTANKDWWPSISGFGWMGTVVFAAVLYWLFNTSKNQN